ncbi:pyocin knob domain-containing protein [Blautia hansenii]|uniref:pyocin knob domain-containing protein n=1 Tax=Blautia hansenii TaxID=1322 RepID=UPI0022E6BEC2|nr:pyocin knob domain-containing protein [Blautia hansenii]
MAQKIINTKIQEAYDTEANWIKYNPVLLAGQLAFSKDKYGKYKIGDGIAKWSQLQYMTLGWNDITGKPSSFTPSSHTHDDRYFTETEATNKFSPKEGSASLSKLASTITLGAGDAATILQNGNTYQQKIEIIDNTTAGDAVFGFYQSGDSGKNFNKLMTINDDGNVVANKFTGALAGNASSASSVPWSGVSGKPSTFPPSTHNHPASQITGLPTKLPNPYALTVKGNGALLNTYDGSGAKEINITPAVIGAATVGHAHSQYAPTSHNHSADNITSGVLPIGRGGTGGTSLTTAANNLQFESIGKGATAIPNNSDLNTYLTPGTYVSQTVNNTGIKNRPTGTPGAFKLVVKYSLGNDGYIQQVMTGYYAEAHMEYTRYYDAYSSKTWSRWVKTFADNSVIPVTSGGTGANTYSTALKNLVINGAVSGSAVPTDTNWYLCSDIADSSGTPVRRSMSSLWSYIKGKTDANYLKLSGTAVSASSIKVPDTRDTNPAPNNAGFKKNAVTFDFKSASKINSPISNTYVGLMSFAPWSETSGGNGYQMAFGYINNTTPRLMLRTADLGASTWGAWYKVYTSADKPTLSELGAAAASHTHNYAGSSSAGGAANSANMLNANAGSSTQPVYFTGGKPVACTYTLGKSVPSNAVFTDTNTWRPVQNNLTSTSTTDSLSANQGRILKGLIDSKAPSSHTHSYLPLSGGTLSGRLTANGRIYATTVGGGWVSGMTPTNASLGISTQNSNGSYHPIIACKTYNSHVWNLGTITDTVGFYGFKKGRTENGTDWSFAINVTNGAVSSTGGITAPSFTGYLNGNAKTATNVAWSGIIGRPSTFTPSSHTHNTINDFKSGTGISISTSTMVTPETASDYDIVVANTGLYGSDKCVTMSKVGLINSISDLIISRVPLKAITHSQIDSLASL